MKTVALLLCGLVLISMGAARSQAQTWVEARRGVVADLFHQQVQDAGTLGQSGRASPLTPRRLFGCAKPFRCEVADGDIGIVLGFPKSLDYLR